MSSDKNPIAIAASEVAPRAKPSIYPEPFASRVSGRIKRQLGEVFGLTNFSVNLTRMAPGSISALRHSHAKQDEFIYVLEGNPALVTDAGETPLTPSMCAGFKTGEGGGHQLVNRTTAEVLYLEIGDRTPGDSVYHPDDDLEAYWEDGALLFRHNNGEPY